MAQLIEQKILLPGASVLERLVSSVREHVNVLLWHILAQVLAPPQVESRSSVNAFHLVVRS
jgi:hypothetical protein